VPIIIWGDPESTYSCIRCEPTTMHICVYIPLHGLKTTSSLPAILLDVHSNNGFHTYTAVLLWSFIHLIYILAASYYKSIYIYIYIYKINYVSQKGTCFSNVKNREKNEIEIKKKKCWIYMLFSEIALII
jgi:hypothetical protein